MKKLKNLSNVEKEFLKQHTDKTLQKLAKEQGINKKVSLEYEMYSRSYTLSVWVGLKRFAVRIAEGATPGKHKETGYNENGVPTGEYTFTTTNEQFLKAIKMGLTNLKNGMEKEDK